VLCLLDGIEQENSDTVHLLCLNKEYSRKYVLYHYQYLLLSFAISRASYCLCRGILHPLVPLLVVQTVFGRVDGFVTEQDSFWHLESVDCVDYTDSSLVFILQGLEKVQSRLIG
jgi:hypothetical protein